MHLSQVSIQGYRNFKNAVINLNKKSLIIGSNEVGKSNFLHALRLLLDPALSAPALEPRDSDFYAHEDTKEILIDLKFEGITQDCVISRMREHISDDGNLFLRYQATRDLTTRKKTFKLLAGKDRDSLGEIEWRYYLKVLNLQFIGTNRDLFSFIRQERKNLIQDAKDAREEREVQADNVLLKRLEEQLAGVQNDISTLAFVSKATETLNSQMRELSNLNEDTHIVFDAGTSDVTGFVEDLKLSAQVGDNVFQVGGDGRNNQIHLALWASRHQPAGTIEEQPLQVRLFCIEEPEAHLHPHQQRRLAKYLSDGLKAQVIITTHSPQIVTTFPPISLVRLYEISRATQAAGNGSNPFIDGAVIDFGYRMSIIPAEAFFSSAILLVEGPSEELFYKALAKSKNIDLDKLNISVLPVNGVGFRAYASLFTTLEIPFVVRTDNDFIKNQGSDTFRMAGLLRSISLFNSFRKQNHRLNALLETYGEVIVSLNSDVNPSAIVDQFAPILQGGDIFLAIRDLENDIVKSGIQEDLLSFFKTKSIDVLLEKMQLKKASSTFSFLAQNAERLGKIENHPILLPLSRCLEIVGWKPIA